MKKTILKRFAAIAACAMLMLLLFSTIAFASEGEAVEKTMEDEVVITDTAESAEPDNGIGFFASLLDAIKDNASEILSSLTLISSIILMFVYKGGFLPMVKDAVGTLGSKVKSISEKTDLIGTESTEMKDRLEKTLAASEEALAAVETALSDIAIKIPEANAAKRSADTSIEVLSLEVEMLYELFMSSALPQYVKDRVGERIGKMRELVGGGDK